MSGLRPARIGFVGTRFAGTDGVSLEAAKWQAVLEEQGHQVSHLAGALDRPAASSRLVPEAFFGHPDIAAINASVFGPSPALARQAEPDGTARTPRRGLSPHLRAPHIARRIGDLTAHLRAELRSFCRDFDLELLVVENALAIPLNLPLGLAITELVAESGMPVIAHHHDLPWERQRFALNSVPDLIAAAFPPPLPSIRHVVINSLQVQQLAWRAGLASRVIPNVMDFDTPPPALDDYARGARADLGVGEDELLILQPTRVVARKGIEHAIELTRRLGRQARLVISHAAGDEGGAYEARVREFARLLEVDVRFAADVVGTQRTLLPDGRRTYTLADVYPQADLVTYGSSIEGFGNAFLEAVHHERPIVVNRYPVYEVDIAPKGFRAVEFDGFISDETLDGARALLDDPAMARAWAATNVELARRHFSYRVLRGRLEELLLECLGDGPTALSPR